MPRNAKSLYRLVPPMNALRLVALLSVFASASAVEVHPYAFNMIISWESDHAQPIATEMNITAIKQDRNQFPYDNIWERDGWIGANIEKGWIKYKVVADTNDVVEYLVSQSGGGSLVWYDKVVCKRSTRPIIIDGKATPVVLLTVAEITMVKP